MTIHCFHCNKEVTLASNRCPHCQTDLTHERIGQAIAAVVGIATVATGSIVGYRFGSLFAGAISGAILATYLGAFIGSRCRSRWAKRTYAQRHAAVEERIRRRERIEAAMAEQDAAPPMDFVAVARKQEVALLASGDYRKCPHCAEIIKSEANLCRFCQQGVVVAEAAYR